jgi:UDP-N-acetylglucosamine 3-dehydrogenase
MKVGVIGLGSMGRVHHRIYSELAGVEVAGVMDPNPEKLREVEAQYGVPVHQELETFLGAHMDAVSVCVPTSKHMEVGLKVIERGFPLLIEKPLAATAQEARTLVEAARAASVPLMVGHSERFNPAVAKVRELLDEGEAISIRIERVGPYPARIQDVGVLKDLGSHDLDLLRHMTDSSFRTLSAVASTNLGAHEDTVLITAQMENGMLGHINTNWVTPYRSREMHVATKTRYFRANLMTQQVTEYSRPEGQSANYSVRECFVAYREPIREELTSFLAALRDGASMPISGEDGLYVLETIERIEKGLKTNGAGNG